MYCSSSRGLFCFALFQKATLDKTMKRSGFKTILEYFGYQKRVTKFWRECLFSMLPPTPCPQGTMENPPYIWETLLKIVKMKYDNLKEITFFENCKEMEIDILKEQASTRSSYDVVLADKARCLQLRFLKIWGSKSVYGSKYSKNVGPCSAVSRHGTAAVWFCGLLSYGESRMH